MKSLICMIIIFWNAILAMLTRPLGLFFGGLLIGFNSGLKDQSDMMKHLKYKNHQLRKKVKELEDGRKDS